MDMDGEIGEIPVDFPADTGRPADPTLTAGRRT